MQRTAIVDDYIHDSQEQIQQCLNCTAPPNHCNACSGTRRNSGKRKVYSAETKSKAFELIRAGYKSPYIAHELGVGLKTVENWRHEVKANG